MPTSGKALISVVIPAFNEEACLPELIKRLTEVFTREERYDFEVIIVENGSTDRSWEILKDVSSRDNRFKVLQLSRNFGSDAAITAGLGSAKGDACIVMMADLEEPPELIPEMLQKWEEGFENVYGVVLSRPSASRLRRLNSRAFYWLAGKMSKKLVTPNASDFRLVDKKVYEAVLSLKEKNQFVRAQFSWVGFSSVAIPFERSERFAGFSKADTVTVTKLALRGLLSNSVVPLRIITATGIFASILALSVLGWFTTVFLTQGVPFDGFGTLVGLNLLGFSILALSIGVVGEYLALAYEETKNRPHFVIRDQIGIEKR